MQMKNTRSLLSGSPVSTEARLKPNYHSPDVHFRRTTMHANRTFEQKPSCVVSLRFVFSNFEGNHGAQHLTL